MMTAERGAETRASNTKRVVDAAIAHYLETGDDPTAAEIAERAGMSVSAVRKVMADAHGCPAGLQARQETRQSYSKNYRAFEAGAHRVWVYGPSRAQLRAMLNARTGAAS